MEKRRIGLDAFQLKIVLCILMLLDHMYRFLPGQPEWFPLVGRVVAPTFVFLMSEGMAYTRNRLRYIGRMYLFGGMMLAGNRLLAGRYGEEIPNSFLMSLAVAASVIYCIDRAKAGRMAFVWLLGAGCFVYASLLFEGQIFCWVLALAFYYLRNKQRIMLMAYAGVSVLLCYGMGFAPSQLLMIFAVLPIVLYNGKRGVSNPLAKYFFYGFYPLHIWVLYLLSFR